MGSSLVLNRRPKVPAEDTAAFGAIAERFRRAGALEQAVSLCREGLKKFPDHVSARVTLGWSLLDLGKYDEARLELEQVMRRAPDNLAAIRGLAELHDRFEHTLNLPMDGPGQWPPPADSLEVEPEAAAPVSFESGESTGVEVEGLSVFSAAPESATPSLTPPDIGLAAEPAAPATVEAPLPAPATGVGTGMSSVREIDAFAGAPIPAQAAVPPPVQESAPIEMGVEELGVIDETLAALIAEADSLDAAADLQIQTPSALESADVAEFGGAIELEASDLQEVTLAAVQVETDDLTLATPAAVDFDDSPAAVVVEPVQKEVATDPVAMEIVEPELATSPAAIDVVQDEVVTAPVAMEIVEPELAASAAATDVVQEEVELAPVATETAEAEIASAPVQIEAAQLEVERAPAAMEVVEFESSPQVEDQTTDHAEHTAEVIEFAARSSNVTPVAEPPSLEMLPDEQAATQPIPVPRKGTVAVAALERMLARVQARRLQLMTESVA